MDICSLDPELEAIIDRHVGPRNESTLQMIRRVYNAMTDKIVRPERKKFTTEDLEGQDFTLTRFHIKTSGNMNLACNFYELQPAQTATDNSVSEQVGEVKSCEDPKPIGVDSTESEESLESSWKDSVFIDTNGDEQEMESEEVEIPTDDDGIESEEMDEDIPGVFRHVLSVKTFNDLGEKEFNRSEHLIIYLHTNTCSSLMGKEVLPICREMKASLLSWDMRAHGTSDGDTVTDLDTSLLDLERVIAWARSQADKIILWARGSSTAMAIKYLSEIGRAKYEAEHPTKRDSPTFFQRIGLTSSSSSNKKRVSVVYADNPIKYLVLDSPFLSVEKLYKDGYETVRDLKFSFVSKSLFSTVVSYFRSAVKSKLKGMDIFDIDNEEDVAYIDVPASFLIAVNDHYIPSKHGTDLAEKYGGSVYARMFDGKHFGKREEATVNGVLFHMQASL